MTTTHSSSSSSHNSSYRSSAPAAALATRRAAKDSTTTAFAAVNDSRSRRSSHGEARTKEEQEQDNHRHSNYLNRKRRAPRQDLSKLTAEEQTRWKRAKARQYSASARRRQAEKEEELLDTVEALSIFHVLIKAAPDGVLLLSPGVGGRILFANDRCNKLLRLPLWGGEEQLLVGRCLWEWMDAADKATVVAAIASGTSCNDDKQHRVRCTLRSPSSPAQQQRQQRQQQQQGMPVKVMMTLRLSERGLVLFLRPEGREE
jgi:PAS domain-containing protein